MKSKKAFIGMGVLLLVVLIAFGCSKKDSKHCTNPDKPYWCSTAKGCCAYRYTDNHGTCFKTMEGCTAGGFACSVCHLEDEN